jgi:hypothetical protein
VPVVDDGGVLVGEACREDFAVVGRDGLSSS